MNRTCHVHHTCRPHLSPAPVTRIRSRTSHPHLSRAPVIREPHLSRAPHLSHTPVTCTCQKHLSTAPVNRTCHSHLSPAPVTTRAPATCHLHLLHHSHHPHSPSPALSPISAPAPVTRTSHPHQSSVNRLEPSSNGCTTAVQCTSWSTWRAVCSLGPRSALLRSSDRSG